MSRVTNIKFSRSAAKGKKLRVVFDYQDKQHTVNFGADGMEHYFDKTKILPTSLNHKDPARRKRYYERHNKIVDKSGHKFINNPLSPSYWSA
jgi:hypothetical protein